jgi:hypothetical protein
MEKLRLIAGEFLKIFVIFLSIRLLLHAINQKPFTFDVVFMDLVPVAALFALMLAIIRTVLVRKN